MIPNGVGSTILKRSVLAVFKYLRYLGVGVIYRRAKPTRMRGFENIRLFQILLCSDLGFLQKETCCNVCSAKDRLQRPRARHGRPSLLAPHAYICMCSDLSVHTYYTLFELNCLAFSLCSASKDSTYYLPQDTTTERRESLESILIWKRIRRLGDEGGQLERNRRLQASGQALSGNLSPRIPRNFELTGNKPPPTGYFGSYF